MTAVVAAGILAALLLEAHVRDEARTAQQRLQFISQRATELAAAAGVAAVATPAFVALAASSGMIAALAAGVAWVKGRIANDPPRRDFYATTTLRRRRFEASALLAPSEPRVAEGIVELRRIPVAAVAFANALLDDDASERAFLRAFERAAGAVEFAGEELVAQRLSEATVYQHRSEVALRSVALQAVVLADSLDQELPVASRPTPGFRSAALDEILPDDVLAVLYRAGIRITELRKLRPQAIARDPVEALSSSLREAQAVAERFAAALASVAPERDIRRRES